MKNFNLKNIFTFSWMMKCFNKSLLIKIFVINLNHLLYKLDDYYTPLLNLIEINCVSFF